MSKKFKVYILSDSVGETAEMVSRAAAEQFKGTSYEIKKYSYVSTEGSIIQMISEAKREDKVVVVFTTVLDAIRKKIIEECEKNKLPYIDVLAPLLNQFSTLLNQEPINEPGIIHRLDEKYFKKVEAIEFAVKYDDGKDPRGIKKADIVLIGVSRTSKTPLSMYLAHKNVKVANVPLVPEVPIPEELFQIPTNRIIGLTTDPIKLNEIRQERLKALGLSNTATYANVDRILEELEYADKIMKKLQCPIINVSNKAVEETAGIILDLVKKQIK